MTTKALKNLLQNSDSPLQRLASRATAMLSLRDAVASSLGADEAARHISDVSLTENNHLIVVTGSAPWAARLRFHSDTLLSAARKHGIPATQCRIKVRPLRQGPETDTTPAR